ncbi:prolipoprotein diacylglyceryl transferase [Granulicella mallensis]|uniref:Prolipoprotein diacylglyceryl transferase n=1 Tax=Granulicella mallensis (strain ATCC BAA-1857 / DSM 23137 / MP5ACTX8) TaxID=682795 RepID=G8NY46_GRAMM|nr:prolipoprotein diacylglyceryl transferase family protein [Granulicella mallensis]AEU36720.1 prolipoprotein diacylglyceryl transferase [Granulicella mallensis MP5ACTX8]
MTILSLTLSEREFAPPPDILEDDMYPFINIGSFHIGTFGLLLWLAAVCATVVLHKNFVRNGVDADALTIVALVTLAGILGAKTWHELENPRELYLAWHQIMLPGWHHPVDILFGFLRWFQAGFAWFGGLLAGIIMLIVQGHLAKPNGLRGLRAGLRLMDFAAPAAAIGYGVGRIGCLTSGDGDYGINTTLPWGVHMAWNALVPPNPPNALVQPTPVYELLFALVIGWWLWKRGSKPLALGFLTGEYLVLSGIGRFLVEFVRINPKLYFGHTMSNAQVAALGTIVVGALVMFATRNNEAIVSSPLPEKAQTNPATA